MHSTSGGPVDAVEERMGAIKLTTKTALTLTSTTVVAPIAITVAATTAATATVVGRSPSISVINHSWFSSLKRPLKKKFFSSRGHGKETLARPEYANQHQYYSWSSRRAKSTWDIATAASNVQIKDELSEVVAEIQNTDNADDSKNQTRAKQMSIGRKKFNMDPKKGIEFLVEHGLLQHTQEEVAAFLYKGEGLNKTAIGDYLGERNEFNEKVLKAFVDLHDFTNLILVQALRQFLWSFRLPGEAQKIDRMMECFAQRYCQLNPNIFTNTGRFRIPGFKECTTLLQRPMKFPSCEQHVMPVLSKNSNNYRLLTRNRLRSHYRPFLNYIDDI